MTQHAITIYSTKHTAFQNNPVSSSDIDNHHTNMTLQAGSGLIC